MCNLTKSSPEEERKQLYRIVQELDIPLHTALKSSRGCSTISNRNRYKTALRSAPVVNADHTQEEKRT